MRANGCALLVAILAASGAAKASPLQAAVPEAEALQVETPPVVDGDVLGDAAWRAAPAATGFRQTSPEAGEPASQRTEVRIVYTAATLYVGIVCFDDDPQGIVVAGTRRDASLDDTDSVRFVLDTYHDRQNGFVFGTNPAGIEYDGQVTREGQGANGDFNLDWDASWRVATRTGKFGWSAEFAIPFRNLRYSGGPAQVWGLNVQRNIRRRNERAYWAPVGRQFDLLRVSAAGILRGISVKTHRNLKATPYVLGEVQRDYATQASARRRGEAGLDLKLSLGPSLTLDTTVNTDFAQVEADEEQINLNRFDLFFPEKRPFFLENAGQFAVGVPEQLQLFFSRRIGIAPDGSVVPILAGARLSGKLDGTNVGLIEMQTREVAGVAPANNFAVLRVARDLPHRSSLGAIFVNRQATGAGRGGDFNRTAGVDGRWGIGRYGEVSGFAARTWTPGMGSRAYAFQLGVSHDSPGWELSAKYTEVGRGFNPEVGFLERTAYRKPELRIFRRYRPRDFLGILELRPHASYNGYWKPDGFQESGFLHVDNHIEWRNGWELHTGVNFTREGLREPFEIVPGVVVSPGTYDHKEVQLVGITNQGAPVSLETHLTVGGFFGGHRVSLNPQLLARLGPAFNARVDWDRTDADLPGGHFVTNLLRIRLSYSFSPRVYLQALVQYNDIADDWSTNLRFGWLQTANVGLFVVYNENRGTGPLAGLGVRDRSVTVKVSRLVNLLD